MPHLGSRSGSSLTTSGSMGHANLSAPSGPPTLRRCRHVHLGDEREHLVGVPREIRLEPRPFGVEFGARPQLVERLAPRPPGRLLQPP